MSEARSLRSSVLPEEKEAEKKRQKLEEQNFQNMPFISYTGKIIYHATLIDCAMVCNSLLEHATKTEDLLIMGFDMEWPFNFQTGPGKTAVIQISPNLETCYILHVSELKSLPKSLSELLIHPQVRLTGVNIKNDIRKLARDFAGVDADKVIQNCIDCGPLANSILPIKQRWSLEKLVNHLLKMRISKDKKVRMSKWHIFPLSKEQLRYAAIDAYASLLLYMDLKEKEKYLTKEQDQNMLNV